MPKISIIVAVFNAEKTIQRCIDSLIYQSLKDIEIVIVDDCSTDGTPQKLAILDGKHNRIKLIKHSSNLSASVARKNGILAATGKYIMFLDADDELYESACEIALTKIEEKKVDILQFGVHVEAKGATDFEIAWFENFVNLAEHRRLSAGLVKRCFVDKKFGFTLWNKIYRSTVVKVAASKINNTPVPKAQDMLLQFYILWYSLTFESIGDVLHKYSYGAGITGGIKFDKQKIIRHMSQSVVIREMLVFLREKRLIDKYSEVIHSCAQSLIEDNLVTVERCAGTNLETFSRKQFNVNWRGVNSDSILEKDFAAVLEPVFTKLSSQATFSTLDDYSYEVQFFEKQEKKLENLKRSLQDNFEVIPIVMAVNEAYLPYLSVAVESLKKNHYKSKVYLYIFYTDLEEKSIKRVESLSSDIIHIEFFDVNSYVDKGQLYSRAHYSVEMYYRIIIPEIFSFVSKVLYLDCDIVVMNDLLELYQTDLEGCVMGAARNPVNHWMFEYVGNKLQLPFEQYFNSGVLLINVKKFNEEGIAQKCLDYLIGSEVLACPDQDALNVSCRGFVKYIDQGWNYQWHHDIAMNSNSAQSSLLEFERAEYLAARENIKILHYTSSIKPWNSPSHDLSGHFWNYAKGSPFYKEILCANIKG